MNAPRPADLAPGAAVSGERPRAYREHVAFALIAGVTISSTDPEQSNFFEAAMRAELQKHIDSIQEALALLRRHL